jgi:uncharacterized protein YndB with AHSA1/START domain
MLIEYRYTIAVPASKVWETLLHPERWWPADHTWSGKRENLSLGADVGGCFCERWDGNSVEARPRRHGDAAEVSAPRRSARPAARRWLSRA